mgnify:CR=1 FL=1
MFLSEHFGTLDFGYEHTALPLIQTLNQSSTNGRFMSGILLLIVGFILSHIFSLAVLYSLSAALKKPILIFPVVFSWIIMAGLVNALFIAIGGDVVPSTQIVSMGLEGDNIGFFRCIIGLPHKDKGVAIKLLFLFF